MRRLGLLCAGALLAVALAAPGPASAKKVVLTESGIPVAEGATAYFGLALGECITYSQGTLVTNESARDELAFDAEQESRCAERDSGFAISGFVTQSKINASGIVTAKGAIRYAVLTQEPPCVYVFSSFKGKTVVPGELLVTGKTTAGRLDKEVSPPGCAKKSKPQAFEAVLYGPLETRLETELQK